MNKCKENKVELQKYIYKEARQKLAKARITQKIKNKFIDNMVDKIIIMYIDELINKFKLDINIITERELPPVECTFTNTNNFIITKLSEPDFVIVEPNLRTVIASKCINKLIDYMEKSYSLDSLKEIIIRGAFLDGLLQTQNVIKFLLESDVDKQYKPGLNDDLCKLNNLINDISDLIS